MRCVCVRVCIYLFFPETIAFPTLNSLRQLVHISVAWSWHKDQKLCLLFSVMAAPFPAAQHLTLLPRDQR